MSSVKSLTDQENEQLQKVSATVHRDTTLKLCTESHVMDVIYGKLSRNGVSSQLD